MKILVLNCGSSSIKYQLFEMPGADVLARGLLQRIGEAEARVDHHAAGRSVVREQPVADHAAGLLLVQELLAEGEAAPLGDGIRIDAIGHRVVHGGERFTETVLIDEDVIAAIEDHVELAPLHNPPNLQGIRVARELYPGVPQVGVFDTAFHQTMPAQAYLYALPRELYREDRIRRYGFHGTSHRYVTARAAELLGRPEPNLVTCHLGNGSSVAAIAAGRSVDTSMGLTPLEGLVMGTRTGDLDPAIIFHLARVRKLSVEELDRLLNKRSGLLGVSGKSNDVRELLSLEADGDEDARLALDIFCYRLRKYIGAYLAVLGHTDAVVFTAGIGENSPDIRRRTCTGLEALGLGIDPGKNRAAVGVESDITAEGLTTRVLVIPTNEERLIAQDTWELARGASD